MNQERYSCGDGIVFVTCTIPNTFLSLSLLFFPQLQGRVTECFPSHISMLVFGYINAMISADTLIKEDLRFDHDSLTWMTIHNASELEDENDLVDNHHRHPLIQTISKNMKLKFLVTKIYCCDSTISFEGTSPVPSLLVES
jgi:hypothetical protein